jgi:hypothetical protein
MQKKSGKMKRVAMSLQSITIEKPFTQWGLDVIGPINPKLSKMHPYNIITTDYFTKWQEDVSLRNVDSEQLILFLKENIFSKFGGPKKFIMNNSSIFIGSNITIFCGEYGIIMKQSSNYYPLLRGKSLYG